MAARMLVGAATREAGRRLRARGFEDLTPIDTVIIAHLRREGELRASELAERMTVTKQAMQIPLKRMEARGYVQRVADPNDGRAQLIRLTEDGRLAARAALEVASEIDRGWDAMVAPELVKACRATLVELALRLDARGGPGGEAV